MKPMKKKSFFSALGFALAMVAVAVGYALLHVGREDIPPPAAGNTAPLSEKIKFQKLSETGEITLAQLRGKIVLINFWASWCGPCISEMPSLALLQKQFPVEEFVVLAVNLDEDLADAKLILKKLFKEESPFTVVKGEGSDILKEFPLHGLPYTAIIDGQGVVRASGAGSRDWDSGRWKTFVRSLIHANGKHT